MKTVKIKNKNDGITLIALIITIIVMLILVAVSISILINSGLIGKAKEAGSKTQSAYEEEQRLGDSLNINGVVYNSIDEIVGTTSLDSGDQTPNTTWQDNVNYTLDEQTHTLTLVKNDTSRTDIYNGDVIIKEKAIINGVEYNTKFPDYCGMLFQNALRMTSFSMENIDTNNVNSMVCMFAGCSSLQSIDLSKLNTSNVATMQQMFAECSSLQILDLSSFNVAKVLNMNEMFQFVTAKLILTGWKIRGNDVMSLASHGAALLFDDCSSSEIIANDWDVSNVNNFSGLFSNCSSLETLNISGWNFSTGCVARGFFAGCTSLSNVTGMNEWNLSNFNLNAAPFAAICQNCTALGNKLTGGIWNNGTWSDGTFTPST